MSFDPRPLYGANLLRLRSTEMAAVGIGVKIKAVAETGHKAVSIRYPFPHLLAKRH